MFIAGVIFSALGIKPDYKAGLGTSPITSLAFVPDVYIPSQPGRVYHAGEHGHVPDTGRPSGKRIWKDTAASASAALLFSACIDGWMYIFWGSGRREAMWGRCLLLLGCVFLGLGIAFEVIPNVLILPGEGLVRVIAGLTGWRFGLVKRVLI